jgi:hypothetical protein
MAGGRRGRRKGSFHREDVRSAKEEFHRKDAKSAKEVDKSEWRFRPCDCPGSDPPHGAGCS